jgi:hypothetical protein
VIFLFRVVVCQIVEMANIVGYKRKFLKRRFEWSKRMWNIWSVVETKKATF